MFGLRGPDKTHRRAQPVHLHSSVPQRLGRALGRLQLHHGTLATSSVDFLNHVCLFSTWMQERRAPVSPSRPRVRVWKSSVPSPSSSVTVTAVAITSPPRFPIG
jgi:hypothetical protein